MTAHAGPMPVPARITRALDAIGADGPWVDEALGGTEPMVDQWEAGELVPTREQIERLAVLTHMPVAYFYEPAADWEEEPARFFLCDRSRRKHALTIIESHIGWDGVLQERELTPPHPPLRGRSEKPAAILTPPVHTDPSRPAQLPVSAPRMRRRAVTARRPGGRPVTIHPPVEDPTAPGCCRCGRRMDLPNDAHGPLPTVPEQAAHRLRVDRGDE